VLATALVAPGAWAQPKPVLVRRLRVKSTKVLTRAVFDVNGPVDHHIFTLHDPERVVVDLKNVRLPKDISGTERPGGVIRSIRSGFREGKGLRVVFDLHRRASPRSFILPPSGQYGYRLVIDLKEQKARSPTPVKSAARPPARLRDVVIAIDAGHGGKDPGAIGRRGTREKDVVLSMARRLEALIKQEPGMRAVLIRDRDSYLPLRERIHKARLHRADLFISIHADAARNRRARGSSVYVLSPRGASSEHARWLAQRENDADLIGGVSLDDKDDVLASVLLDLSQTATNEASIDLADSLLAQLRRVGRVRSKRVERAGFAVLKSPDIPSVLVETAFISNPSEEKRLRSRAHQQALAKAMLAGIRAYFRDHAPSGTLLAQRNRARHVIRRGETLSAIAARYHVDVSQLRRHNALKTNDIRVGQVLRIPTSDG
jgi:N-acetylmuramoyl-L-alanine amidase